jgi:hypothetical protein
MPTFPTEWGGGEMMFMISCFGYLPTGSGGGEIVLINRW